MDAVYGCPRRTGKCSFLLALYERRRKTLANARLDPTDVSSYGRLLRAFSAILFRCPAWLDSLGVAHDELHPKRPPRNKRRRAYLETTPGSARGGPDAVLICSRRMDDWWSRELGGSWPPGRRAIVANTRWRAAVEPCVPICPDGFARSGGVFN